MSQTTEAEWVAVLREQCAASSQKRVGMIINYSNAVVNQVLKGTYKGDLKRVESAVKGAFMNEMVGCPIVGEIATHICLNYQKKKFSSINPLSVQLYKACRNGCPHSKL